jgi:hypothetical protein
MLTESRGKAERRGTTGSRRGKKEGRKEGRKKHKK